MIDLDEMKRDMEAGAVAPWVLDGPKQMEIIGRVHRVLYDDRFPAAFIPAWDRPGPGEVDGSAEAMANARRIARVPDMEATIIAQAATIESLTVARDQALRRERALLDSNQQERTALVEAASLRAELMREREANEALRARVKAADELAEAVEANRPKSIAHFLAAYRETGGAA